MFVQSKPVSNPFTGFKTERVQTRLFPGKEVVFVRSITPQESRGKSLPGLTLGPRDVQRLFDENPANIRNLISDKNPSIIRDLPSGENGAFLGLAVATKKPLAEHINREGLFSFTINFRIIRNEARSLVIEPGTFEKAGIDTAALGQNGKMLFISEHYTVDVNQTDRGLTYSFRVFDATPDSMQLVDQPKPELANIFSGEVFYEEYKSDSGDMLGSVQRGGYGTRGFAASRVGRERDLSVGCGFYGRHGVFKLLEPNGRNTAETAAKV